MNRVDEIADKYSSRSIESKSKWYSPSAIDYDKGRPEYPAGVIADVISKANINATSKILEIGSGPGTATQHFSEIGCTIDCIEPNPDFVRIAQHHYKDHLNIRIHQSSFEEYEHKSELADIVLAGTSFHWVNKQIAFEKSSRLMSDSGYLVLLWNNELQPNENSREEVQSVYKRYAPELYPSESESELLDRFDSIGQWISDTSLFQSPFAGSCVSSVNYTAQRYINALKSYSPYLKLDSETQNNLFFELTSLINEKYNGAINLKLVSGYHIAEKA